MKNKIITLQTYPVGKLPEGIFYGNDTMSDEWLDSHLTEFTIEINELKRVLAELEIPYHEFLETWTYDTAFQIYHETNNIINEKFITSDI